MKESYALCIGTTNQDKDEDFKYHKPNLDCNNVSKSILRCKTINNIKYIYELDNNGFIISVISKQIK